MPNEDLLISFTDAVIARDRDAIQEARQALVDELGVATMVDAAGVISSFQGKVRTADSTGIPVDPPMYIISEDLREELAINEFNAAVNTTKAGIFKKLFLNMFVVPMFRKMLKGEYKN